MKSSMKAIRLHTQGGPEQVVYEDAPRPALREGDALVRVLASGITRDELIWGPTYTDEKGNSRVPTIPGHELCGTVEALAPGVMGLVAGETVYGLTSFFRDGTAAEFVAVNAADLAPKPGTLDPVEAASVPLAALTAWQALFDHAHLLPGQKILIHGGAGGVGTFAVQIARWHGAHVIATAAGSSADLVKGLGAQRVIDYKTEKFEEEVSDADVVLDCIGGDVQDRSWQVLRRGGVMVSIAGESIQQPSANPGVKGIFFIVKPSRAQLIEIGSLIDGGFIRTVIGSVFPLDQARQAFKLSSESGKHGKIVLRVV
jgi:NADPH:quinone reductase-like Zn-dependent oxidoreductase